MGHHRFRLSDMMPNAWFYKLRDMSNQTRRRNSDPSRHIHARKQSSPTSTLPVYSESRLPCYPMQDSFYRNARSPTTLAEHLSYGSPATNTKALDFHIPPSPSRQSPKRSFTTRKTVYKSSFSPRKRVPVNLTKASHGYNCTSTTKLSSVWSNSDPALIQDALYYSISPCSDHLSSPADSPPSSDPFDEVGSWSSSCSPRFSSSTADIIIDINEKSSSFVTKKLEKFDSHVFLPPILTKTTRKCKPERAAKPEGENAQYKKCDDLHEEIRKALHEHHRSLSIEVSKQETNSRRRRRRQRTHREKPSTNRDNTLFLELEPSTKSSYSKSGSRAKVRGKNSPRVLAMSFRKMQVTNGSRTRRTRRRSVSSTSTSRSSLSEGFAMIKCSYDPEKDFRDSMMEMIVEHHIQTSKDLEDLLACYLTLNSKDYHDLIVKAFEQIWCDMFFAPVSMCTAEACG